MSSYLTHNAPQSIELSRLAVYLDSGGAAWAPPGGWDALAPADAAGWDALFAAGIAEDMPAADADASAQAAPVERQYVLSPVRHPAALACFGLDCRV
jgi:hypothetical protein